ncbi:MAG: hypothetical protein QXF41_02695 [Candidatus Micrarchaeaceae archaeon]
MQKKGKKQWWGVMQKIYPKLLILISAAALRTANAEGLMTTLSYVQQLLMHIGPMLSAVLFIVAGIFYAVGQLLPPDKRANFHTTSINIIIGAVVVAVLSVASSGLAVASTHLLSNISINATR